MVIDGEEMEPYYTIMRLPGEPRAEFIQMLPFTPRGRNNMAAWMAARSDGDQYGKILVVGPLVMSLVVGMSVRDTSGKAIANLEYEKITHDAPVFQGDTIYGESEILETRESRSRPDRGIVYMESRAFNQDGVKVVTLRRRFLCPKRPQ